MRPVSLQLEGFGGFRSATTIDFEDLDLIALVGKTGAGKSTVIDAITFALYGMVARYDDARKVHPVINALSTEAKVQFVFESGDRRYIASRVIRRTKSGASTKEARLQQDEAVLADGAKEVTAAVEEVVGLDFGQFTKVVVLPQGRFSAFLRDSAKDRRKMLTETLGLDHYEALGRRAREIAKDARVSAEEKRTTLDRFDVAAADLSTLDGEISELTVLHTLVSGQAAEVQAADANRFALIKAKTECEAWIDHLDQIQLPTDVADVGQEIEARKIELASAAEAVKDASLRWQEAMAAAKAGPDENQCRQALSDHEAHESFTSQLNAVQAELDNENQRLREATEEMAGFEEKAELFDRELAEAEQVERDQRQHVEGRPSSDSLRRIEAQRETLRNLGDKLTAHEADVTRASDVVAQAEHDLQTAEAVVENVDWAHQQAAALVDGEALRSKLVVGEPCPVCIATVEEIPVVGEAPQNLDNHGLEQAQENVNKCRSKLEAARSERTKQETLRAASQQSLEDLTAALKDAPDDKEVAAQLAANDENRRALADATQHREELATTARQYRHSDGYAQMELRVKQANVRMHKLEKKEMALAAQHGALASRLCDAASPEALLASIDVAQSLHRDEQAEEKRRVEALAFEASIVKVLTVAEAKAAKLRSAFTGVRDRVADLKPPPPGTTSLLEDWKDLVDWASDQMVEQRRKVAGLVDEIRSADYNISQQVSFAVNAVDSAAVLQSQPGDRLTIDLSAPARSLSQAERSVVRLLAATEGRRSAVSQQLEQAVGLRAELTEVEERHRVYELLGNELKASNFQDWILGEIVAALAARGSDRLYELSSGQFSLDADELDFVVVDHTNGDTRRDAKTLSGGETFLASLALALALADGIVDMSTRIANPVESLFLDEGFGTLDRDYLDVVASAVEELGAQGRMVVVITHIDELAERMPTRFELVKTQGTSAIERVDA